MQPRNPNIDAYCVESIDSPPQRMVVVSTYGSGGLLSFPDALQLKADLEAALARLLDATPLPEAVVQVATPRPPRQSLRAPRTPPRTPSIDDLLF